MFPFVEALGKSSHFIAGTSPTRWDKYIHRLLVYAITLLGFIGLATLVTADMGVECIENCRQSSGRCLDHGEAANKRPFVNAACEDYKEHGEAAERFCFFAVCMFLGIVIHLRDSDSDSDTPKLVKDFNELDHDSALQVVAGVKKFSESKSLTNCNVNPDEDPAFALTTGRKARGVLKQIVMRNLGSITSLIILITRDSLLFCILQSCMEAWKQKSTLTWSRAYICNRTEFNLVFICTYRSPWSLEIAEFEKTLLTSLLGVYLAFLFAICLYNSLILILVILKRRGYSVGSRVYLALLITFETRWLFRQRFGYDPNIDLGERSQRNANAEKNIKLEVNDAIKRGKDEGTHVTFSQVDTNDTVALDIECETK